jgi:ADP-ribose diphosphatase
MPRKPRIHRRRVVADTGVFTVEQLDLEFANGERREFQRIIGVAEGAVLVVPMLDPHTLLLCREYAAGMDRYELAFPKGLIEPGEDALGAANREIQEEIGYAARRLEPMESVTIAPGYLQHTTHIVIAGELYPSRLPGDEPEPIEVVPWPLSEWRALLEHPDFTEARSIAALLLLRARLPGAAS